jgi:hypothetical protein
LPSLRQIMMYDNVHGPVSSEPMVTGQHFHFSPQYEPLHHEEQVEKLVQLNGPPFMTFASTEQQYQLMPAKIQDQGKKNGKMACLSCHARKKTCERSMGKTCEYGHSLHQFQVKLTQSHSACRSKSIACRFPAQSNRGKMKMKMRCGRSRHG